MKLLAGLVLSLCAATACSQSVFPVRDSSGEAPNRAYHVVHYKINVAFDEQKKSVAGTVTTTLVPFMPDFRTIVFDAESLNVESVTQGMRSLRFSIEPKSLTIQLDRPYSYTDTITVSIQYTATPKKGLYFTQPDSGYPDKPSQIWTQGEDMDNHFWFPCHDFPNDHSTSEVIATVRSDYTLLSNGKLIDVREDKKKGTKTFHWSESKPHVSYLIMIAAGKYAVVKDHAGKLPLEYYVYPNHVEDAKVCFAQTPDMIRFFSTRIGVPYPWEKYAQVLIADFIEGGMENVSATSLMDEITVFDPRARLDESSTSLIAHELAHQWWGDLVTCKDWRHLWLNESFASYFDPLYHEYAQGRDRFEYIMYNEQNTGINTDKHQGRKPIVSVGSFVPNVYARGAAVLHMLRYVLGDSLFWRSIHHYIVRNAYTSVETNDLKEAIEDATGQNLYWFFDEWLYKAGHPVFNVSYRWVDSTKVLELTVNQTQKQDSLTGIFRTPVDIGITTPRGATTYRMNILTKDTVFALPCPEKPELVIFDKGNWLLKELNFEKPRDEWKYQAEHAPSPVDRLRAIKALADLPDSDDVIPLYARIGLHDSFTQVRSEALSTLAACATLSDSMQALRKQTFLAASRDRQSSVRNEAIASLGTYHGTDVVATLHDALTDSSYLVVSSALRSLTHSDSANAEPVLLKYLNVPSFRNRITNTVLGSLGRLDSVRAVAIARTKVRYGEYLWTRYTALTVLGRYGKHEKDIVPMFVGLLHDPNSLIRSVATRMLGDVGDASVLPALETIARDKDNRDAKTAESSIEKIKGRESHS